MGVWRIKRFIDAEILVTEIIQGNTNNNEKLRDELGNAKRSSHKENLVSNGMVGSINGILLDDVVDQRDGLLIAKDTFVTIAPGEMTHEERADYWNNPDKIIGKIAKFKLFPKGIKDKPRFPQFLSLRDDYIKH
jgi:DNA ligase-1